MDNYQNYQALGEYDNIKDYCELCETEKPTGYEYNGDYICESCYTGLADRAEAQWESQNENWGINEGHELAGGLVEPSY
jgi:hypothetical protein